MDNPRYVAASSRSIREIDNPGLAATLAAIYGIAKWATTDAAGTEADIAGCPTSEVDLFFSSKQWTEIAPGFHAVEGPVAAAYPSSEDYPGTHYSNDHIIWVRLADEESYKMLSKHRDRSFYGQRQNQLQVEWEEGSVPDWIKPYGKTYFLEMDEDPTTPPAELVGADRVWILGKWVFDCGHLDGDIEQGGWTEIHPPIALATMRGTTAGKTFRSNEIAPYMHEMFAEHPSAVGLYGVKIDLWINGDGGKATEILGGGDSYDISGIYEFNVPLPPEAERPISRYSEGTETEFYSKALRLRPEQPQPEIELVVDELGREQLHVVVDLRNYEDGGVTCISEGLSNCDGSAYGTTIIAGWPLAFLPEDMIPIRLTAEYVTIFNSSCYV